MDPKVVERFWRRVTKGPECWEWRSPFLSGGYGAFTISGKTCRAHRVAYELTRGPIPPGVVVMHLCDNRKCVRPEHLRLGTNAENSADMVRKGRSTIGQRNGAYTKPERVRRGVEHGRAKMDPEKVCLIRGLWRWGETKTELARTFGVSLPTITQIVTRTTWAHVNDGYPKERL